MLLKIAINMRVEFEKKMASGVGFLLAQCLY